MSLQRSLPKFFEGAKFVFFGRTFPGSKNLGMGESSYVYVFAIMPNGDNIMINSYRLRCSYRCLSNWDAPELESIFESFYKHTYLKPLQDEELSKKREQEIVDWYASHEYLKMGLDVWLSDVEHIYEVMEEKGLC